MIKFFRWFLGISWIAAGIGAIVSPTPVIAGGILLIIAGLFFLPPTFNYLGQKTGQTFGRPLKVISVLLLFIGGISLLTSEENKNQAEKKKQEQIAFEKLPQATKDSISRAKVRRDSLVQVLRTDSLATVAKAAEKEKIQSQFSAYDGSHPGVERAIKQRMNDPDSYEHVSTRFIDKGKYIAVLTQFRGRNAFNGKVLNTATAKVDYSGNVLELNIL